MLISSAQQLVKALNSNTISKDRSRSASKHNTGVQRGRGKSQTHSTPDKSAPQTVAPSPAHSSGQPAERKKTRVASPGADQKVNIMGESPLAQRLALDLGAVRVPSIGMGDSITDLTTALDQGQESVKVVFVDYQSETGL